MKEGLWFSSLWLAWFLALAGAIFLALSLDRANTNRKLIETTRFTDAVSFFEKINDILVLNSIPSANLSPIKWETYRDGLFVQGKTVLRVMKGNDTFLTKEERTRLQEMCTLFKKLKKGLLAGRPLRELVGIDHRMMLLSIELAGWSASKRESFFYRIRLLDYARAILLLSALAGGGVFLFGRTRLHRKTSRQNRFYQALLRIDQLILTLPTMEELLPQTCRIIVEESGVMLVRFIELDAASGEGSILAYFGKTTEGFARRKHSPDPSAPGGSELWADLVRLKEPLVWNSLQNQLRDGSLRNVLLENGIFSGAGIPVFREGTMFGTLILYSDEENFFDPDLMNLIGMMVKNISFAIENRDREDDRKKREEEVTRLALFDNLTGLPNRRLFHDRMQQAVERHLRTKERFGVGILDLDGFKQVNDRLGHPAGDALLIQVSERIKGILRGTDTLARLGGDEFGIIFTHLEAEKGSALFDRVIRSLAVPFTLGEEDVTIGGSLGITIIPPDDGRDESLLKHADLAMYQVKEQGKNGWEIFQPAMTEALENSYRLKKELEESLGENRFALHYQPQVELASGRLVGVEALLRWNHPERGLLDSESFIGILAGCDLAIDIERWALEEILSQIEDWSEQGIRPRVKMNIGSRHLLSGRFTDDLRNALSRHPEVPPQALELDITETKSFPEISKVKEIFDACRRLGVSISVANIGTEHGSIAYIQTLGVDRVTIDRRFVRDLPKSPQDMAIVASLVTSAKLLLVDVVGEGIETEEEGDLLLRWGCRIGQGFGIAHPMVPEEIPGWAERYRPFESWSHWAEVPWDPQNYPLLLAKEAARVFYENFLDGIAKPGVSRVEWTDSHRCLQGRWIDGDGQLRYGATLEFRQYRDAHEHLHSLIREAILSRDAGDFPRLDTLKEAIREVNAELIRRIDQIRSLGAAGPGS